MQLESFQGSEDPTYKKTDHFTTGKSTPCVTALKRILLRPKVALKLSSASQHPRKWLKILNSSPILRNSGLSRLRGPRNLHCEMSFQ
jgi:hypothetical protein